MKSDEAGGIERSGELARLPILQDLVICREVSSHDRRGGNDNGFSNKAEYVRRERGLRVCIADMAGPGCVQSAWFGWPSHPRQPRFLEPLWKRILGRIRFVFDREERPRLDVPIGELIGAPPFTEPLAFDGDRSPGGFISYVPVPFAERLRVSVGGGKVPMFFYHLWYHVYPHGTEVKSWSGSDAAGCAYFRLPMPFTAGARLVLENRGARPVVLEQVAVDYGEELPPAAPEDIGFLRCEVRDQSDLVPDRDVVLAELQGRGKIVGLVLAVEASETFLEGDERISTDGCRSPQVMGDATETYFNGGWYFYERAFACPLHGAPTFRMVSRRPGGRAAVTMYRFHATDWVPYRSAARFTIQHGPFNNVDGRYRSAVWYYGRPQPALVESDRIRLAAPAEREAHGYAGAPAARTRPRTGFFEGERSGQDLASRWRGRNVDPMLAVIGMTIHGIVHAPPADCPDRRSFTVCEHREPYEITVAVDPGHRAVMLRRLFDQSVADQHARIEVDGETAGVWFNAGRNRWKIWCEDDLVLDPRRTRGKSRIRIRVVPLGACFTACEYTVFSIVPAA